MKHRSLLTLVPAVSAWLALRSKASPLALPTLTDAGFSIAVQCWTFKEFTLFEAIEMAAAAGANVELFPGQRIGGDLGDLEFGPGLTDAQLRHVIDHLAANHIAAVNYGVTDVPNDETEARRIFELARKLGLHGITTESIDAIDLIEKLAAEYEIKVGFHNHPKRPLYQLWDPDFVFAAVKDRHENLGLCADTGHWASCGMDPLEVIRRVAPRVRSLHLKDRASIEEWTHDRPLGTGIIDSIAILDEVRKHGFTGNVTIEYEHNWETNIVEVAQCAGYLRAYSKSRN